MCKPGWWVLIIALVSGLGPMRAQVASPAGKPVIHVVASGGTIANTRQGYVTIDRVLADIRSEFPDTAGLLDSIQIETTHVTSARSQSFTSADFLKIARTVNRVIQPAQVRGVIVTQGTFTSEETAYFLHLLVKSRKPVVLTNSQRPHDSPGNDGDRNLLDAVRVILTPEAAGKGVLVVTNQTINSAREVIKTSDQPGAFVSGMLGELGVIKEDRVAFYRAPTRQHTMASEFDIDQIQSLPKVEVISAYYDADPGLVEAAVKLGVRGIVINGFTTPGIPHDDQLPVLTRLAAEGIPIVRTARGGPNNRVAVEPDSPFIGGDNLVPHKARILLQLALTRTTDAAEIQRIFDQY